jgi:hypothetical protein
MKVQSIGRENIFFEIKNIILQDDGACHFVPITGKGGSGKTMLFNQIQEYFDSHADEYPHVLVVNYDYRDLRSQSLAGTLYINVCKMLQRNPKMFPPEAVEHFFRMLLEMPEDLSVLINFLMIELEYLVKAGIRLVLLEDTIEVINAPSDYINNTFQIGAFLPNCVAIVAGRPEDNTYDHLEVINSNLGNNDWVLHPPFELTSFSLEETKQLVQSYFGDTLGKDLIKKIHLLTNGSPIHLAIVIEVLNHNPNLEILHEDIDVLEMQFNTDKAGLISRFEYDMLAEISKLGSTIDWTILYLAYLNRRYDRKIIKLLMGGNDREIEALEDKYKSLLYLRKSSLPSREKREILHDEIQRMINSLIWDRIDFMKEHRKAITYQIIEGYYQPEIKKCEDRLLSVSDKDMSLDDLTRYLEDAFNLAELQNERLDYLLRVDVPGGIDYFHQLAEEVNRSPHPNFFRLLLHDGVKNIGLSRYISSEEIEENIYQASSS